MLLCTCGIRHLKYIEKTQQIYQFNCLILYNDNNECRHVSNNIILFINIGFFLDSSIIFFINSQE